MVDIGFARGQEGVVVLGGGMERANVGSPMRHSLFLSTRVDVKVRSQVNLLLCLRIQREGRSKTHSQVATWAGRVSLLSNIAARDKFVANLSTT